MMRENQGLEIAVVLFFMLTVVLAVSTFVCFRQYVLVAEQVKLCQEDAGKMRAVAGDKQLQIDELKRLMGFAATEVLETVRVRFGEDMRTYAASFPEQTRFYHSVLAYQHNTIRDKSTELAELTREIQAWKDQYERLEGIQHGQVMQHRAVAVAAQKDLAGVQEAARQARSRMLEDNDQMRQTVVETRREGDLAQSAARREYQQLQGKYQEKERELAALKAVVERLGQGSYKVPDGRICGVSYRLGLAWIDLGRADSLQRAVSFDVYEKQAARMTESTKKGSIETTNIIEDYLAEARVVDEQITDPILRGDKIHSALWVARPKSGRFPAASFR